MGVKPAKTSKLDDHYFPVRVRVAVPDNGYGRDMAPMQQWLTEQVGAGRFAWHSGPHGGGWEPGMGTWQTSHVYFVTVADAARFVATFGLKEFVIGERSYMPRGNYGWGA